MDHDQLKDLLPLEALGRLEGEERAAMAAHLAAGCDECEAELRQFREALAAMAMNAAGEAPADRIWSRLESRLKFAQAADSGSPAEAMRAPSSARGASAMRRWRIATAVAAAAAVVLAMVAGRYASDAELARQQSADRIAALLDQNRALAVANENQRRELAIAHLKLSASGRLTQAMLAPDARVIRLGPLAPARGAAGIVAVSEADRQAVLHVAGLPAPPPGKEYELWWIGAKSGPLRAAVFAPGANGSATVASTMPPTGERLLASAITLEPAGGVNKPTGAAYLKGVP